MRAAQYVRMSTERQEYSVVNQMVAIKSYALLHNFEVIKTYSDLGKSGIDLAHRPGLRTLLEDVTQQPCDFSAILVYDVSRWGRFQDIDESAYYEFVCKRAGVQVHYCAEPFASNDPGIMATLLKAIKRAMAGEYLRELSAKTLAAQCRIARSGYKLGGKAGYGLRRMLVARDGTPKGILSDGERKAFASDRVIYVPGPPEEVAIVRQVYSWYLDEDLSAPSIAKLLNERGICRYPSGPWDQYAVNTILNHPKYTGCVVFNRTTKRLRSTEYIMNPRDQWIVTHDSFEALISEEQFQAVRKRRKPMRERSDAELLSDLRTVFEKQGKLTAKAIRATPGIPAPNTYWIRFGSLGKAYAAVGYNSGRRYFSGSLLRHKTQGLKAQAILDFARLFRAAGKAVRVNDRGLSIRGIGGLGIETAQCITLAQGRLGWEVRLRYKRLHPRAIIGRISADHQSFLDFTFLNPIPKKTNFRLTSKMLNEFPPRTADDIVSVVIDGNKL